MKSLSLKVAVPELIPAILRNAAEDYAEKAKELDVAFRDKRAGKRWRRTAGILELTASRIEEALE